MRQHILVVDRSHTIRVTCAIHLQNVGHLVLTFPTSMEALKKLPTCQPLPDMLLLGLRDDSSDVENRTLITYLQRCAPTCHTLLLVRSEVKLPTWATSLTILPTPFTVQTLLDAVHPISRTQGTNRL